MYLLNDEKKVTLYDIEFNNRNEVMKLAKNLATDSINVNEYTKSANDFDKMTIEGDKQSICNPVYIGEKENDVVNVVEYTSKTPYTLGIIGYYAKNNWLQSLYSSREYNFKDKHMYLKKIVDRMMNYNIMIPQLLVTKCHFDPDKYLEHDRVFESLKDNSNSLNFLIEQYYPDLKAFIDLLPYIDFIEQEVFKDNYFNEDSLQGKSANWNTKTIQQLGLTPNIRK